MKCTLDFSYLFYAFFLALIAVGTRGPLVTGQSRHIAHFPGGLSVKTPCSFIFEGKDPGTGLMRRDVEPAILFRHTDLKLEPIFQQRDLVIAKAHLTALSGGIYFLNIEFFIATEKAAQTFGGLVRGDFIQFRLMNGQLVRLVNVLTTSGKEVSNTGYYVFRGQYRIGEKEEKILRKAELDSLLVRWKNVQEEYEIYELDFLKQQFNCLGKE